MSKDNYGKCPICMEKGTCEVKLSFVVCDNHTKEDVFLLDLKDEIAKAKLDIINELIKYLYSTPTLNHSQIVQYLKSFEKEFKSGGSEGE